MSATAITAIGSITRATTQTSPAETNGDAANGNSFTNDGRTQLWYRNAGATPRTLILITTKVVGPDSLTVQDPTVTVAASSDWVPLGYLDPDIYGATVTVTPSHSDVRLKVWTQG